jgi:DNA/RNA endonuclease YhcR with UshA esterase domain
MVTCAEVLAGPDGKVFMVKGICTGIANTQYGNWYLNDGTGEVYIYGTVDATGAYNWASFNIAVGDEVTVQGPKKTYGTTIELVDVSVLKVKKALLSFEQDVFNLGCAATTIVINASVKGDIFNYENEASWLSIASVKEENGVTAITVNVAENTTPEARSTELEFSSSKGKDVTNLSVKIVQAGQKGQTPENPYTVADAIATIAAGAAGTDPVYIKGKISKIDSVSPDYGNATYWISDDGGTTTQMQVYRGKKFGGAAFVAGDALGLGWEVIIYGSLTEYNGKPQINKNSAIYSIEGATAEMTTAEAIAYIDSPEYDAAKKVIVSGKVFSVNISTQYGNAEVWISDDGSTKAFELYRNLYFKGEKYTATDQLKAGDTVKAVGVVKKYGEVYEMDKNNYLLVLNGLTAPEEVH